MESTIMVRTGSGRLHFPTEHHHLHHDFPKLSRTHNTGCSGLFTRSSSSSPTGCSGLFTRSSSSPTVHTDHTPHRDMRGVPILNTLRRAASCDSDPLASSFLPTTSHRSSANNILSRGISTGSTGMSASLATTMNAKSALVDEEVDLEFSGGGSGRGSRVGGGGRPGSGSGDQSSGMGEYYNEMLQADPENPLLLMNYGKFLHDVQGDLQGAEDCFGRAVLVSPGDGEALSLYGNLVWEAHKDDQRADDYFQRAVQAASDDCYVLGSYAHFLWNADEEEQTASNGARSAKLSSFAANGDAVMVKAYST